MVRKVRERRAESAARAATRSPRRSLDEIGLSTGTDKSSEIHDYLNAYEAAFRHLRDESFQLIEIGVHKGASINMWAEYFPRATLVGIDISPACMDYATDRITIRLGNQGDAGFLADLAATTDPLIVIDDGSHVWQHQIQTFRALFPIVRAGGFFVVEDIHTSFGDDYATTYGKGHPETAFAYLASLTEAITAGTRAAPPRDDFERYCRSTIESIVFLKHSVIVKKRAAPGRQVFRRASLAARGTQVLPTEIGPDYERVHAEVVGGSDYIRNTFQRLVAGGPVHFDDAASGDLQDVLVKGAGLVLTASGHILSETLNCAQNIRLSSGMYRPGDERVWVAASPLEAVHRFPQRTDGKRYVLLKQTWDGNYGHWLIDTLPKVGLAEKLGDVADFVFVVNDQKSPAMRRVVVDSLALVGIDEEQLLWHDGQTSHFEQLVVLGTLTRHPVMKSRFAVGFLEQAGAAVPPVPGGERLYVSRNDGTRRRLLNEDEVIARLSKEGYRVVNPAGLSLHEQIGLFRSAESVVGNLGAGFTNLVFSPAGVSVLALTTATMPHDFFYDIVCHKQGRYRGLQGVAADATPSMSSDFTVDLDLLGASIDWLHHSARA